MLTMHGRTDTWTGILPIFTVQRLCIAHTMPCQDVCLSVHLSISLSHPGILPKQLYISSKFFHRWVSPNNYINRGQRITTKPNCQLLSQTAKQPPENNWQERKVAKFETSSYWEYDKISIQQYSWQCKR